MRWTRSYFTSDRHMPNGHYPFLILLAALLLSMPLARTQSSTSQLSPSPNATPNAAGAQSSASALAPSRTLLAQGKYNDALAALHDLEEKNPGVAGLSHEFGVAYYKKADYLNAIVYLKKAREENPDDGEAIQLLGISFYLAGRPADAIAPLEKVQTWFPTANVDASYILGTCYIQTKDYPHARGAFAKMFGVSADSAASYLFTARMLLRQDFGPVAEEYAQKAVSLDPKLPLAHFLLGELDLYHSKVPEAADEFQKELQLNPGYAPAYYKLADAYSRIEKFEEAEKLLQRSIWLDSTSTGPYILMGKVLAKKGETELAVRTLQRALAMDPNNPVPHHLLGQAYRDLGRSEDAERELKVAAQLEERQTSKP
jgi:tetratricopeptide (TPR) repeat protein